MGIIEYEQLKMRQQEIEVRALVALSKYGNQHQKLKALKHLEYIAYPELLTQDLYEKSRTLGEYE